MAIHTSDGEVHQSEWDYLVSTIFNTKTVQPPQQDLNSLWQDLAAPETDANGNKIVPK